MRQVSSLPDRFITSFAAALSATVRWFVVKESEESIQKGCVIKLIGATKIWLLNNTDDETDNSDDDGDDPNYHDDQHQNHTNDCNDTHSQS